MKIRKKTEKGKKQNDCFAKLTKLVQDKRMFIKLEKQEPPKAQGI